MEKLSYSYQIVTCACHTFVTYLFAARPGEWRHTADALRYVIHHDVVANNAMQQCWCYAIKTTIKIEKLYTYNDGYTYALDSFLCHNLFAELLTHLIRSIAMFYMPM